MNRSYLTHTLTHLVHDDIDERAITHDDARSHERHARVLHAAEREARGKDKHIVAERGVYERK